MAATSQEQSAPAASNTKAPDDIAQDAGPEVVTAEPQAPIEVDQSVRRLA